MLGMMREIPTLPQAQLTPSQGAGYPGCLPSMGVPGDAVGLGIWGRGALFFPAMEPLCIRRDSSPPRVSTESMEQGGMLSWRADPIHCPAQAFPSQEKASPALCWQ